MNFFKAGFQAAFGVIVAGAVLYVVIGVSPWIALQTMEAVKSIPTSVVQSEHTGATDLSHVPDLNNSTQQLKAENCQAVIGRMFIRRSF